MIDKNTKLFISASQSPGNFGATVFNRLFSEKNINAVYLPRKFEDTDNLQKAIRYMGISGCAVSNPMKTSMVAYVDQVDEYVKKLNSVNTIVNNDGILYGHNTDWIGAQEALGAKLKATGKKMTSARILGSGGVVSSIVYALHNLGIYDIAVASRNQKKAEELRQIWKTAVEPFAIEKPQPMDILVNAIPSTGNDNGSIFKKYIDSCELAFDIPVSSAPSSFVQMAAGKEIVQGYEMAVYQLREQFRYYTGQTVEATDIFQIVKSEFLKERNAGG